MIFAKMVKLWYDMDMTEIKKIGSDNVLEDYFLDLLVEKHIIDREIQDLLDVIEKSAIHPDYQRLMKKILFWEKNIYLENWGTLETSLADIIKSINIRGNDVASYGIVLRMMMRVIEEVFDVEDEYFHDFILSEEKEDVEHRLIILMKRILDYVENGLRDMITHSEQLDEPIDDHIKDEFLIIKSALLQYPAEIMTSQKNAIEGLKIEVDAVLIKIKERKKNLSRLR